MKSGQDEHLPEDRGLAHGGNGHPQHRVSWVSNYKIFSSFSKSDYFSIYSSVSETFLDQKIYVLHSNIYLVIFYSFGCLRNTCWLLEEYNLKAIFSGYKLQDKPRASMENITTLNILLFRFENEE